ncbi:MAG: response regulator transcription factor [Lachnospiraceae bacterium]|jgi:two-component system response regulator protein BraR/BceR|nr:response regulator transcription factor [Lachnospiraceae bacterium]MCI8997047.1 response regulator transcription factor [Lachnospiraceae bacterium]MCI9134137.1 response regulator transcription factor [Lachnospiraceae bacterium]
MQKIMIIEDDPVIRQELSLLLETEGYQAWAVTDFASVPDQTMVYAPDLILLDLGLPGQDGWSVCAAIRKRMQVPIIFVTSRDSAMDELRALNLGGDDYITKPYNIPVLMARIKTVLRRTGKGGEAEILEACGLRLHLTRGTLEVQGQTAELTRNEIQILACLMKRCGEIVSRADLIDTLWDNQIYIDDNTLSVNMTRLRTKLAHLGLSDCIRTRRGLGYQL